MLTSEVLALSPFCSPSLFPPSFTSNSTFSCGAWRRSHANNEQGEFCVRLPSARRPWEAREPHWKIHPQQRPRYLRTTTGAAEEDPKGAEELRGAEEVVGGETKGATRVAEEEVGGDARATRATPSCSASCPAGRSTSSIFFNLLLLYFPSSPLFSSSYFHLLFFSFLDLNRFYPWCPRASPSQKTVL